MAQKLFLEFNYNPITFTTCVDDALVRCRRSCVKTAPAVNVLGRSKSPEARAPTRDLAFRPYYSSGEAKVPANRETRQSTDNNDLCLTSASRTTPSLHTTAVFAHQILLSLCVLWQSLTFTSLFYCWCATPEPPTFFEKRPSAFRHSNFCSCYTV